MHLAPPKHPLPCDKAGQILYPVDNGEPLSNDTEHLQWIFFVKSGLDVWLAESGREAFVCGDVLWYPVEGRSDICKAPDVMLTLDHPPGYRSSYMQWKEQNRPIQVAFEFMSASNTASEMMGKLEFYSNFGCEEFYLYDYQRGTLQGFDRKSPNAPLSLMEPVDKCWRSKLLGLTLGLDAQGDLWVRRPDGRMFETFEHVSRRAQEATDRAEEATKQAKAEAKRAKAETLRADVEAGRAQEEAMRAKAATERAEAETQRAARLAAKLRDLGVDPDRL